MLHNLDTRVWVSANPIQPRIPALRVLDAVLVTQSIGAMTLTIGSRHPSQQDQTDLRTEPRSKSQRVTHWIRAAVREVQLAELRIGLLEVRDGRHYAGLQALDCNDVLDPSSHRVAGQALRVGDHDFVRSGPEYRAQRSDLGRRAPTTGRREGLVRHEDGLRSHLVAVDAPLLFGLSQQQFHLAAYVVHVEAGPVECAIARNPGQNLCDRPDTALRGGLG